MRGQSTPPAWGLLQEELGALCVSPRGVFHVLELGFVQFWGHGRLAVWLCWFWGHQENTEAESPSPIPDTGTWPVLLVCLGQSGALLLSQLWFCWADLFSFSGISCSSGHLQERPVTSSLPGGQEGLAGTQQVLCPPVHPTARAVIPPEQLERHSPRC